MLKLLLLQLDLTDEVKVPQILDTEKLGRIAIYITKKPRLCSYLRLRLHNSGKKKHLIVISLTVIVIGCGECLSQGGGQACKKI